MRAVRICLSIIAVLGCLRFPVDAWSALSPNLDTLIVYPNPFQPKLNHTSVTFDNTTASVRIRIYKVSGELVFDKEVSAPVGKVAWDVTNNDGHKLGNGIYIYMVTNENGQKKTGKIAIIR